MFLRRDLKSLISAISTLAPLLGWVLLAGSGLTQAQTESVLYSFNPSNGTDGVDPNGGLVRDKAGDLYGTTQNGGAFGQGTVYKVAPDGTETVLYTFTGGTDGGGPSLEQLALDSAGNLYGTTNNGGTAGEGTVFMLSPLGLETVLHSFGTQPADGANPYAGVVRDSAGNLYGTTYDYGAYGAGTVFKLTPSGTLTTLHSFSGGTDGCNPFGSGVVLKKGFLYGTTVQCGASGVGVVFSVSTKGIETVLYTFTGAPDGSSPTAGVIFDRAGNLYGTTAAGGQSNQGTVFKLTPTGNETVLHSFACNGIDGCGPQAGLIIDNYDNLYGTTQNGGTNGLGSIFEVTSTGGESVLYSFGSISADAANPTAPLIFGKNHNFYGTSDNGGAYGPGAVFQLSF